MLKNPYRGAAPPESMVLIGTTKPYFIDIPFDGGGTEIPYEGDRTLEEAVEELGIEANEIELEGPLNDV